MAIQETLLFEAAGMEPRERLSLVKGFYEPEPTMTVFSFSRLDKFENGCPNDWFNHYFWGIKEPETIPTETGHIVHSVGEQFLNYLLAGGVNEKASIQKANRKVLAEEEFAKATLLSKSSFTSDIYPMVNRLCDRLEIEEGWSYYPEYNFFFPVGRFIILQGFIDFLAISPNGKKAIIRDYKSNRAPYGVFDTKQLSIYAFVVSQLFPEVEEIEVQLHFLRFDSLVKDIVTPLQMSEAVDWVIEIATKIQKRLPLGIKGFEPKPGDKCEYCANAIRCLLTEQKVWIPQGKLSQADVDMLAVQYMVRKRQYQQIAEILKGAKMVAKFGDGYLGAYIDEFDDYDHARGTIYEILTDCVDPLSVMSIDKKKLESAMKKFPAVKGKIVELAVKKQRTVFDYRSEPPVA